LARLPQPFTRADEDADYCWQLPDGQIEFSTTMAPGPAGHRADLLRAADPRQPGYRPPGHGEHRLRPDDPPARQVPHPRDLPHPGHHDRHLPLPLPVPARTPTTGSTSTKAERPAP